MSTESSQSMPLERQAFDRLRAEYEEVWLESVYVEPIDFDGLASMRSIAVFGEEGIGKTALRIFMTQRVLKDNKFPLIVQWHPVAGSSGSDENIAQEFIEQVMDSCAQALLRHIGDLPKMFLSASPWIQETVVWFVHRYLAGDKEFQLMKIEDDCPRENMPVLHDIINRTPRQIVPPNSPPLRIIAEVAEMIERLGLTGIWVTIDGLEAWLGSGMETPEKSIKGLLSTLAIFEHPAFVIKIMAPTKLETRLSPNEGFIRRRCDVHHLTWKGEELNAILQKRLAITMGKDQFNLADLCDQTKLQQWLERYGGLNPRGWLELVRPLVDEYLSKNLGCPLKENELTHLQHRHPPRLRIDIVAGQVFIGYGIVENLSPSQYKLLRYLYENRPRPCTRRELYFRAYRGMEKEPRTVTDPGMEGHLNWENTIDTALWRLRGVIEPQPESPIYIVSEQGKGTIHLENAW